MAKNEISQNYVLVTLWLKRLQPYLQGVIPLFRHLIGPTTHYSENLAFFGLLRCRNNDTQDEFSLLRHTVVPTSQCFDYLRCSDISFLRHSICPTKYWVFVGLMSCRTNDTTLKPIIPTSRCSDSSLFRHLVVPTAPYVVSRFRWSADWINHVFKAFYYIITIL